MAKPNREIFSLEVDCLAGKKPWTAANRHIKITSPQKSPNQNSSAGLRRESKGSRKRIE